MESELHTEKKVRVCAFVPLCVCTCDRDRERGRQTQGVGENHVGKAWEAGRTSQPQCPWCHQGREPGLGPRR